MRNANLGAAKMCNLWSDENLLSHMMEQNAKNQNPATVDPDWNMTEEQAAQRHVEFQRAKTEQEKPENRAVWLANYAKHNGQPRAPLKVPTVTE